MIRSLIVHEVRLIADVTASALRIEPDLKMVGCAHTTDAALTLLRKFRYDVLLVSITLPNDGAARLTHAMTQMKSPSKILITGLVEAKAVILPFLEAGAAGYVLKDEALVDLIQKIRGVHRGEFPVSAPGRRWTRLFLPGYRDLKILRCAQDEGLRHAPPSSAEVSEETPRSYLFNGFSDFIAEIYPGKLATPIRQGLLPMALPEARIVTPLETILFGEKAATSSAGELDVLLPNVGFLSDLDEARHGVRGHTRRGQSNFGFADGGVRPLPFGECTCPINLWGITESARRDQAICRPR